MRKALPYWGPRWYARASAECFLDAGIARWDQFKLTFSASARRPPAYLRSRLKVFDYLWQQTARSEAARELVQGDKADLGEFVAKLACNMLFGTWAVREQWRCRLETTSHPDDITFDGFCSTTLTPGGGGVFGDVLLRQRVLSLTSMAPVHRICLEQERLQVARALRALDAICQPQHVISVHADGVFVHPPQAQA